MIVVAAWIDRILNAEEVPSMFSFLLSAYHLCLPMLSFVLFSFFCVLSTFLVVYNNRRGRGRGVVKQVQDNVLNQRIKIKTQSNSVVKMMIIGTSVFLLCYGLLLLLRLSLTR